MKTRAIVVIDPEIMSGTPCFAGTRVPAQALLDYLEAGDSLDEFLEDFPTVTRKQTFTGGLDKCDRLLARDGGEILQELVERIPGL